MARLISSVIGEAVSVLENKPKLGSGKRFDQLVAKLARKESKSEARQQLEAWAAIVAEEDEQPLAEYDVKDPAALAAWIGRKKYGKERFQKLAAAGRKKA